MASVNKIILVGNVGGDPEIRALSSGSKVANFSLATSERWKSKEGEQMERTAWHRICVFNENLVRVIEAYVKKGTKLYIEGAMEYRKWTDQSGVEKISAEVMLRQYRGELVLLDSRVTSEEERPAAAPARAAASRSGPARVKANAGAEFDDEIPFQACWQ